uniref:Uncharacterized protein n=1 Tax=Oryza meridionalis TaxID=40149 RepID=A0A0E0F270_9ORYZ
MRLPLVGVQLWHVEIRWDLEIGRAKMGRHSPVPCLYSNTTHDGSLMHRAVHSCSDRCALLLMSKPQKSVCGSATSFIAGGRPPPPPSLASARAYPGTQTHTGAGE